MVATALHCTWTSLGTTEQSRHGGMITGCVPSGVCWDWFWLALEHGRCKEDNIETTERVDGELRWFAIRLDPDFKEVRLVIISDVHYGNPLFSKSHFKRTIDFVAKNPDVYAMLNGDMCESALKTSKGDIYRQVGSPQDQRDWIIDRLEPIKSKIIGMDTGNHEWRIMQDCGLDISKDIADALHIPYRAEGIKFKILFGNDHAEHVGQLFAFKAYCTHGYGGARTKAAKAVKAERVGAWMPDADLIAMSHDHVVNVEPSVAFFDDSRSYVDKKTTFETGKISAHRMMIVKTNAYLKWGGYAEMGGYPPNDLSTPVIYLLTPQSKRWEDYPEKPCKAIKVGV